MDGRTDKQTHWVTTSLLELFIIAKKVVKQDLLIKIVNNSCEPLIYPEVMIRIFNLTQARVCVSLQKSNDINFSPSPVRLALVGKKEDSTNNEEIIWKIVTLLPVTIFLSPSCHTKSWWLIIKYRCTTLTDKQKPCITQQSQCIN